MEEIITTYPDFLDIEVCEECKCEECNREIYCNRACVYIITKGDEEIVMCQMCFHDLWEQYRDLGWGGDDIESYMEDAEEEQRKKEEANQKQNT